jgi:hypothetical protein
VIEEAVRAGVERGDGAHLVGAELEVERFEVLRHALLSHRLGIATMPRCVSQRTTTCAMLLPWLSAIDFSNVLWKMSFFPSANGPHDGSRDLLTTDDD